MNSSPTLHTASLFGITPRPSQITVAFDYDKPSSLSIVGLSDRGAENASALIKTVLEGLNLFPKQGVLVTVTTDGIPYAPTLHLPIALAIIAAANPDFRISRELLAVGSFTLSGQLTPVPGVLPIAAYAKDSGFSPVVVPCEQFEESNRIEGLEVLAPKNLADLVAHLNEGKTIERPLPTSPRENRFGLDLADVQGHRVGRRALEIAAAGGHNLLLIGNPGSGKTMLARRLCSLLAPLTDDESLETDTIYSAASMYPSDGRPFRAPHHTCSDPGLFGGGHPGRPGEVSLAHNGVLFLDDITEYRTRTLRALNEPLTKHQVALATVRDVHRLPANFILVATAPPCPCGWLGSPRCHCPPSSIERYARRLSTIISHFDLTVSLSPNASDDQVRPINSSVVLGATNASRRRAKGRGVPCNARLPHPQLEELAMTSDAKGLYREFIDFTLHPKDPTLARVLGVARTISDMMADKEITKPALTEAIGFLPSPPFGQHDLSPLLLSNAS